MMSSIRSSLYLPHLALMCSYFALQNSGCTNSGSGEPNVESDTISLRGVVLDADTMDPIEGATVSLSGDYGTAVTDDRGEYTLEATLPSALLEAEDELFISVASDGYTEASSLLVPVPGSVQDLDLMLAPDVDPPAVVSTSNLTINADGTEGTFEIWNSTDQQVAWLIDSMNPWLSFDDMSGILEPGETRTVQVTAMAEMFDEDAQVEYGQIMVRSGVIDFSKPTAVEYAVMLSLIIVVCLVAITTLGNCSAPECATPADSCTTVTTVRSGCCRATARANGSMCDDHNLCTSESCQSGRCMVTGNNDGATCYEDTNPCTAQLCEAGSCMTVNVADGTECTDNNPCTTESCIAGVCTNGETNDEAECDDGDPCTSGDLCDGATCAGPIDTCNADPVGTVAGSGGAIADAPADGGEPEILTRTIEFPYDLEEGQNLYLSLDITHSWRGDLLVVLSHGEDNWYVAEPDGNWGIDLLVNDYLELDEDTDISGTWTLSVSDHAAFDVGTLNSWSLSVW